MDDEELDVSSLPLLRMDQLERHTIETLRTSLLALPSLIDQAQGQLADFASQLCYAINKELQRRAVLTRIQNLFSRDDDLTLSKQAKDTSKLQDPSSSRQTFLMLDTGPEMSFRRDATQNMIENRIEPALMDPKFVGFLRNSCVKVGACKLDPSSIQQSSGTASLVVISGNSNSNMKIRWKKAQLAKKNSENAPSPRDLCEIKESKKLTRRKSALERLKNETQRSSEESRALAISDELSTCLTSIQEASHHKETSNCSIDASEEFSPQRRSSITLDIESSKTNIHVIDIDNNLSCYSNVHSCKVQAEFRSKEDENISTSTFSTDPPIQLLCQTAVNLGEHELSHREKPNELGCGSLSEFVEPCISVEEYQLSQTENSNMHGCNVLAKVMEKSIFIGEHELTNTCNSENHGCDAFTEVMEPSISEGGHELAHTENSAKQGYNSLAEEIEPRIRSAPCDPIVFSLSNCAKDSPDDLIDLLADPRREARSRYQNCYSIEHDGFSKPLAHEGIYNTSCKSDSSLCYTTERQEFGQPERLRTCSCSRDLGPTDLDYHLNLPKCRQALKRKRTHQRSDVALNACSDDSRQLEAPHRCDHILSLYSSFSDVFSASIYDAEHLSTCTPIRGRQKYVLSQLLQNQSASCAKLMDFLPADGQSSCSQVSSILFYRVCSPKPEVGEIIGDVLTRSTEGWRKLPEQIDSSWNLFWSWSQPIVDWESLLVFQKVNHFRQNKQLTSKDILKQNLLRFAKDRQNDFSSKRSSFFQIMPGTFTLPREYNEFVSAFSFYQKLGSALWIMKPIGLSRGRGIEVIGDVGRVSYAKPSVIQKYIENPLLLRRFPYKFDLRIYVLVTSFNPLEAFIYKEGFARFATLKFTLDTETLHDVRVHLTNSSIQSSYLHEIFAEHPALEAGSHGGGNKTTLEWLWGKLKEDGHDVDFIWSELCLLCVKALVCVEDRIPFQPNSFELFGFDVMFDTNLQPWLLEVNSSPSLARDHAIDITVKESVVRDAINVVQMVPLKRKYMMEVCNRRLLQVQGRFNLAKSNNNLSLNAKEELLQDLTAILGDVVPRQYGELPKEMGLFERLAPHTSIFRKVVGMRQKILSQHFVHPSL